MINVLIVEDSIALQQLLRNAISSDPLLTVVGVAANREEAVEAVQQLRPDVIAMGWQRQAIDGLETTRRIMETTPIPIVLVTGSGVPNDAAGPFRIIEAGALAIVQQPPGEHHPDHKKESERLTRTLQLMSEVKLVKRTGRSSTAQGTPGRLAETFVQAESDIQVVAIGASTGGPNVLQTILSGLSEGFPVPLFIVQHIAEGFTAGFVEWLQNTTPLRLRIASHGENALPGHAYIAPDQCHMGVERGPRIALNHNGPEHGARPSVACLFRSVAQQFGSHATGVLLTGMGRDGADELKIMKDNGAVTFAQNEESSIIHGMPGEAIKLHAATYILSPEGIAVALTALTKRIEGVIA
ncbi:MAG: chemotaxis protein CheB [Bacteroidota bacterium]